jgi:hypothetical protein
MRKRIIPPCPEGPIKFIPCNEHNQTFNFQRTNKKATYRNMEVDGAPTFGTKKRA